MSLPSFGLSTPSGCLLKDVNPVLRERYFLGLCPEVQAVARDLHLVVDRLCMADAVPMVDGQLASGEHVHHHFQAGRTLVQFPEWVTLHVASKWEERVKIPEDRERTYAWLRSRPPEVKDLLRRFPPSCLVTSVRPSALPGVASIAIVCAYFDDHVVVTPFPDSPLKLGVSPESLHVVGFMRGWTPARIAEVLD